MVYGVYIFVLYIILLVLCQDDHQDKCICLSTLSALQLQAQATAEDDEEQVPSEDEANEAWLPRQQNDKAGLTVQLYADDRLM